MDHFTAAMDMLDHIHHPAFCVREGIIIKSNLSAQARLITSGTSVSTLFDAGFEDYEAFQGGCLHATLRLDTQTCGVSITRKEGFDLFILEESDQQDLRALALAARELREPLSGLMITADRLFPNLGESNPEIQEQAARMNRNLFQLLRIVGNMADASRFESDTSNRREIRDVAAFVAEIADKARTLAAHTSITLTCAIHPEAVYTQVDSEKLERALLNLLSNALKFTPAGGHVHLTLTRRGNRLWLTVEDDGCGIPEQIRSNVFSRYTREPGVEDGRFGVGLGLVLIRAAAASHGGTVLVDHPEGTGTRVTMTMAIRTDEATLRSPRIRVDYAGEWDHSLVEFSNLLPPSLYMPAEDSH